MANITGLITVNSKDILEVDADPSAGGGTPANMGSLAMFDTGSVGQLYLKNGAADTAWTLMDSDSNDWSLLGNTLAGTEKFGSLNDQDVKFYRNNIEMMRMVGSSAAVQGLLIGLNASLGGRLQLAPAAAGDDILKEVLSPTSNPVISVSRLHRLTTVSNVTAVASIAIPTDYNAKLIVDVIARQTGGSAGTIGDANGYQRSCVAQNLAGAVTMFKQQTDYTYEIVNQFDFSLAASGANITGTAQGVLNRNVSWGVHSKLLMITT